MQYNDPIFLFPEIKKIDKLYKVFKNQKWDVIKMRKIKGDG